MLTPEISAFVLTTVKHTLLALTCVMQAPVNATMTATTLTVS